MIVEVENSKSESFHQRYQYYMNKSYHIIHITPILIYREIPNTHDKYITNLHCHLDCFYSAMSMVPLPPCTYPPITKAGQYSSTSISSLDRSIHSVYLVCVHNTLLTPSTFKGAARPFHIWIGRVGLLLGVLGFVILVLC